MLQGRRSPWPYPTDAGVTELAVRIAGPSAERKPQTEGVPNCRIQRYPSPVLGSAAPGEAAGPDSKSRSGGFIEFSVREPFWDPMTTRRPLQRFIHSDPDSFPFQNHILIIHTQGRAASSGHPKSSSKPIGRLHMRRDRSGRDCVSRSSPGTCSEVGHLCRIMKVPGSTHVSLPLPQGAGAASLGT